MPHAPRASVGPRSHAIRRTLYVTTASVNGSRDNDDPASSRRDTNRFFCAINVISVARLCLRQVVFRLLWVGRRSRMRNMPTDIERREPSINPAPRTPSDDDIRKAQAIREALRKLLLNQPEPQIDAYWAVGAD